MTRKLLIIEDSRLTRSMIHQMAVDEFPELIVLEAPDAESASLILAEQHVDLVTLDHNMPGLEGMGFVPQLKKLAPDARVCMITANLQNETVSDCRELGICYLPKPVEQEALIDFLRSGME